MKQPAFVELALRCLGADLLFLLLLPFWGPMGLMALFFYTPVMLAGGVSGSLDWLEQRCGTSHRLSLLSRSICGSGLILLLLSVALLAWENTGGENIWGLLCHLYLVLLALRFTGAGLFNIPLSLVCLFGGKTPLDRLSSFSALLTSAGGLWIMHQWLLEQNSFFALLGQVGIQDNEAAGYIFWILFLGLGFLSGLVWGAVLQWFASKWQD
jgi:hypothetical protein